MKNDTGVLDLDVRENVEKTPVWSEEFDVGTVPDSSVWSCDLGGSGWGNSELQTYTSDPANLRVEGSHLVITGPF